MFKIYLCFLELILLSEWGNSVAWSITLGLGPGNPGSNPGYPVFLF